MRSVSVDMTPEECRAFAEQVRGCRRDFTDANDVQGVEEFALYLDALARRLSADAQTA
jgi:hypothetical protein